MRVLFPRAYIQEVQRTATKTYYFDVREAKNGIKYLTIAESRIQDGTRTRNYFTLFPEQIGDFLVILQDMSEKLKQQ